MVATMLRAQSGEQATSGPCREAVTAAVGAVAVVNVPKVAHNAAVKVLAADALCANHGDEVRQRQHPGRTNVARSSTDAVYDAIRSSLGAENVNAADVMLVCEAPLPVLRKLLGEDAMEERVRSQANAGARVTNPSVSAEGDGASTDSALLETESVLFRCSEKGPSESDVATAATLAMSRSLMRDDLCAAASVCGPLRRCVIAHWRRLAWLSALGTRYGDGSDTVAVAVATEEDGAASLPSSAVSEEEHESTVSCAAFSGIGALMRLRSRDWEVQEEAIHCVTAYVTMNWERMRDAALSRAAKQHAAAIAENVLALARFAHLIVREGGEEARQRIGIEQTVAAFTPVLQAHLSSFSPLLVERTAEAILVLSEVSQSGDLPTMTVAATQALFSLWERTGFGAARTDLIVRIARASSRLAPAASSASIVKCISLTRLLPARKDKLRCLRLLCDAALQLSKWNVMACRRGLYRPHDVKVDLQILSSDSAMRDSPFREELFASLMRAAFSSLAREFGDDGKAGIICNERERDHVQSPEDVDRHLEWLAVFTQTIELVACCLHWDANPLSRVVQGLWFRFVVRILRTCKAMHLIGASTTSTIAMQLQRRIHTVLRTLLSSVSTVKDSTLRLQIFWCTGCHIQLDGDDASDIANSLTEKVAEMLNAVAVGTTQSRRSVQAEAANRGAIVPNVAAVECLSPVETFLVEIAFAVLQRFWLIGSALTMSFLSKAVGDDGPVDRLGRSVRADAALKDRCWRVLQLARSGHNQGGTGDTYNGWPDEAGARQIFGADGCSFCGDDSVPFDGINPTSSRASFADARSGTKVAYNFLSMFDADDDIAGGGLDNLVGGSTASMTASGHAPVCGALLDMTGASDPISIRGEHHMSSSARNLVLTFRVTNQSIAALPEITLSAMLCGPVQFGSASQRQSFHITNLLRGESRDWRIPVVVTGVARSSVVIEVIATLDGGHEGTAPPLTMQSKAYNLPLCAALRYPKQTTTDASTFYALWASLPFRSEKRAQVDIDEAKLRALRAPERSDIFYHAFCSEIKGLPLQFVCAESVREFGGFRACFQTETTGGDIISIVTEGFSSICSTSGSLTGIVALSARSTSCDVISSLEDTTEGWFSNLMPSIEHKIIDASFVAKTQAVADLLMASNTKTATTSTTGASSTLGAGGRAVAYDAERTAVSVLDMNDGILGTWRASKASSVFVE